MNAATEYNLWQITLAIYNKGVGNLSDAERIAEPLVWFVKTCRCSGSFAMAIAHANKRTITTIAKRLIKANSISADYQVAINSIRDYIGE